MPDMPFETGNPPPGPSGRFKREHILLGVFAVAALGITAFAFIKLGRSHIDVGSDPDNRSAFDSQVVYRQPEPPPAQAVQADLARSVSPMPIYRGPELEKKDGPPPPPLTAEGLFDREFVLKEEHGMRKAWFKRLKESPVVRAYEKEWMSQPDLKALKEKYTLEKNPVSFIKELSGSKNFYKLVAKYGTNREMISTLMDALKTVSPEAMKRANKAMNLDDMVGKFVDGFGNEVGVPISRWIQGKPPTQAEILKTLMEKKPGPPGTSEAKPLKPAIRPKTKKRLEGGWKF